MVTPYFRQVISADVNLRAGAVAAGMGSWLIGDGEPAGVTQRARRVSAAVSAG
jgi:hypothetical protein